MRARSIALSVVLIVFAAIAIGAQQTRDAAGVQNASSGSAVISGTLLTDAATPQPVRRAVVRLAGAAGTIVHLTGTDDEGQFVFAGLPAGNFALSATKTGYVRAFHGSTRPGRGPGVPIAVANGQRLAVTLKMLPGAVITGTITDLNGRPVSSVPVVAVEVRPIGVAAAPTARATTDDRGVYRIFGLVPGDYLVSASPAFPRFGTRLVPSAEVLGVTDAEIQWARGRGQTMPPSGRPVTFAQVYYPGTTDAVGAATVSVGAGEERANVGFAIRTVTTATIGGTIVDHTGQPIIATVSVSLYPRGIDQDSSLDRLIASGVVALPQVGISAPAFMVTGVPPGDYTLMARTGSAGSPSNPESPTGPPTLWSVTELTIDGRDQTDLVLQLQPGMKISGSIVFERSSLVAPEDVSRSDLSIVAARPSVGLPAPARAAVDRAGTFRFSSVVPGTYALKVTPPPAPAGGRWTLKSALLNGRDLADVWLDVKPGQDITGMAITFADRESEISGTLVDASGQAVTRYSIVVFTVDRSLWLPNARRIRSTTLANDGTFRISGLPAGEYAIAAAENVEAGDLADPAFLSQLLAAAHRVTIAEGEKKTQNLRIGG